jgi:signal transduction histidine kinase
VQLASIIEKRQSLHRRLANQQEQYDDLNSHLTRLQALANIGTATHMVAHEINNLLTPLSSFATLALRNPDDKSLTAKALEKTVQSCERASRIMESMLAVANGETQEKKNAQLITLVEDIFTCLCRDFSKDGITVEIRIPEGLTVWAVPVQIQQVLMNLILNARDAMLPRGGVLTIKAQDTADAIQIEVADTGCGIKEDDFKRIFEPFFTTKADKKSPSQHSGSGLGLVFVKKIIDEHGGRIAVQSKPSQGSKFKITLPKSQQGSR